MEKEYFVKSEKLYNLVSQCLDFNKREIVKEEERLEILNSSIHVLRKQVANKTIDPLVMLAKETKSNLNKLSHNTIEIEELLEEILLMNVEVEMAELEAGQDVAEFIREFKELQGLPHQPEIYEIFKGQFIGIDHKWKTLAGGNEYKNELHCIIQENCNAQNILLHKTYEDSKQYLEIMSEED